MSTSAHIMTENSVIRHYKKQLIHRQHDLPDRDQETKDDRHVREIDQNGIYDFVDLEPNNGDKTTLNNVKKTRKKRKNRNCRGQFRHEGMELIKLGTIKKNIKYSASKMKKSLPRIVFVKTPKASQENDTSHSLCKTKEPFSTRIEKEPPRKEDQNVRPPKPDVPGETNKKTVIQSPRTEKTIILEHNPQKPPPFGHSLPQMVPERRNSREMIPPKPPERRNSTDLNPPKVPPLPPVSYSSPPRLPPPPEYRVPIHPNPYLTPPFPQPPLPFGHNFPERSPPLPPPPPYPTSRSPSHRPIPVQTHHRPAFPPAPIVPPPFPFPYPRHSNYRNGYPNPPIPTRHPPPLRPEYVEGRKRKLPEEECQRPVPVKKPPEPPVVAAIDLTVDQNNEKEVSTRHHKCHCECGKTYSSEPVGQEVIITVTSDRNSTQVPSLNLRGKVLNGVLKLESQNEPKGAGVNKPTPVHQNGVAENKKSPKITSPVTKVAEPKADTKIPQLFLIKDLLAKGVRVEKSSRHRIEEEVLRSSQPTVLEPEEKRPCEPRRVIVSPGASKTHSIASIITRRPSSDVDTISVSSGESVRSADKQAPQGKLFYYKANNSFIRYFEDAQKRLFLDNLMAEGEVQPGDERKEVIELPKNAAFSTKESLSVEEYVTEMTLAEKFVPKDFFSFYKFVTGYQICNNHPPVSFLIFLKMYNTNGLKILLDRYVNSLKQSG